jgi:hypothetical protein
VILASLVEKYLRGELAEGQEGAGPLKRSRLKRRYGSFHLS